MVDILNENGLQLQRYDETLNQVQTDMNSIYATDGNLINFDSSTPDGQFTNILAQIATDNRELVQDVYNSFDPDKVGGILQDIRYSLNYLVRNGGTFTIQNIDVTCDSTVTLQGLDDKYNDINASAYCVSDNAGNNWYLIDTTTIIAGTHSLPFRSQNMGLVQPTIGTIVNQVTKVLGVTSVINSVAPTTLGVTQESDKNFRIRRSRSTATYGQNNNDAMLGQILALEGVTDARNFVNIPGNADYNPNIPDYVVWNIIEGGANDDIANVIYQNSNGLPTYGDVSIDVLAVSGQVFNTKFDRAKPVALYIRYDFKLYVSQDATDLTAINEDIAEGLTYSLGQSAETSVITEVARNAILNNGGGGYALNVEISLDGSNWVDYIETQTIQEKFVVDTTRIFATVIEMD